MYVCRPARLGGGPQPGIPGLRVTLYCLSAFHRSPRHAGTSAGSASHVTELPEFIILEGSGDESRSSPTSSLNGATFVIKVHLPASSYNLWGQDRIGGKTRKASQKIKTGRWSHIGPSKKGCEGKGATPNAQIDRPGSTRQGVNSSRQSWGSK